MCNILKTSSLKIIVGKGQLIHIYLGKEGMESKQEMLEVMYCEWRKIRKSAAFGVTRGQYLECSVYLSCASIDYHNGQNDLNRAISTRI